MSRTPTNEEILAVREYECQMEGHMFHVLEIEGREDPVSVLCDRCGKSWGITVAEEG